MNKVSDSVESCTYSRSSSSKNSDTSSLEFLHPSPLLNSRYLRSLVHFYTIHTNAGDTQIFNKSFKFTLQKTVRGRAYIYLIFSNIHLESPCMFVSNKRSGPFPVHNRVHILQDIYIN